MQTDEKTFSLYEENIPTVSSSFYYAHIRICPVLLDMVLGDNSNEYGTFLDILIAIMIKQNIVPHENWWRGTD